MVKENATYIHNGILVGHKNGWDIIFAAMWMKMENTVLNKTDTERQAPQDLIHIQNLLI